MEISSKQRAFLKKKAHKLKPIVRIGKEGLKSNVVKSVLDAITKKELIKVKILENSDEEIKESANYISEETNSQVVQIIGNIIILYKENKRKPKISEKVKEI